MIEANSDIIKTRDLVVKDPHVVKNLSGPAMMEFKISQGEATASSYGITWKNQGQMVVAEIEVDGERQVFCYGIVDHCKIDPQSGDMSVTCTGVLGYPKGIPFLQNFNPIAVDPFEIVQRVWAHLQGYSNANLGVVIEPASSGTQMLPGYSFDGSILSFDFFAVFYRAVDFQDCADIVSGLARDIPFDMIEEGSWNSDRTEFQRSIHLGYPLAGFRQDHLSFRLGENVLFAEKADEKDIEPVSDVIVRSWLPGKVMSAELSNEDPTRYRRTIMEENAEIDSTERAAAWARRKLTRRNIPKSFQSITIDPNHPHGPYGSFDVGDSIWVAAQNYPWVGDITGWHRVTSIDYTESTGQGGGGQGGPPGTMKVGLKVEGAWDYDPIEFIPDTQPKPVGDPNRVYNGYFAKSMRGWTTVQGQWIRVPDITYATEFEPNAGSVRIDCDDPYEELRNGSFAVTPGEHLTVEGRVQWENVESTAGQPGFILRGYTLDNIGTPVATIDFDSVVNPTGTAGWFYLKMNDWVVPAGVTQLAMALRVDPTVTAGTAYWTYIRVYPVGQVVTPVVP